MIDRENVMSWLERLAQKDWREWYSDSDVQATALAALILLREQEPKKGFWLHPTFLDCCCSVCGMQPEHEPGESVPLYDYCPYCGAEMEVKWE